MKRISLLTAVILCLCLFVSSCGKQSDVPTGMKLASMEEVSYSLFVPESWIVDLQTKATTAHVSQNDRTSISVTSWDAPNTDYSFEQWEEHSRAELDEGFTDYNELEVNEKIIDGIAAKEYVLL